MLNEHTPKALSASTLLLLQVQIHKQLNIPDAGRGTFTIKGSDHEEGLHGHLPDTFVSVRGWGKGLAWINGHNLGWYWASIGPQVSFSAPWCMSSASCLPRSAAAWPAMSAAMRCSASFSWTHRAGRPHAPRPVLQLTFSVGCFECI